MLFRPDMHARMFFSLAVYHPSCDPTLFYMYAAPEVQPIHVYHRNKSVDSSVNAACSFKTVICKP